MGSKRYPIWHVGNGSINKRIAELNCQTIIKLQNGMIMLIVLMAIIEV